MFLKYILTVTTFCSAAGIATADTTTITPTEAKACIAESLSVIKQDPTAATQYVDRTYVRKRIQEAFEINGLFMFLHQHYVTKTFRDLATKLPQTVDATISVDTIQASDSSDGGYMLTGTYGTTSVELFAKFYTGGNCKLMDARFDGMSIIALLIGRLGSEDVFADQIGGLYL